MGSLFATSAGLEPASTEAEDPEDSQVVDLGILRELKQSGSDANEPEALAEFKRGDAVAVTKKMTWHLGHKAYPDYRKGVAEGPQRRHRGLRRPCNDKRFS